MKERISEDFCELLEEQIEKIVKKGDISPTEMDSAYKAVKSMYYLDEMKKGQEEGYSGRGGSGASGARGGGRGGNSNASYGSYDGNSGGSYGNSGGSYENSMRSYGSYEGGSGDYSEEGNSGRRGRDARGRYTSRDDEKEQMKRTIEEMKRRLEQM